MSLPDTPAVEVVSENFPPSDSADLVVSSSDGTVFHVHKKNLSLLSNIFADADAVGGFPAAQPNADEVTLTETAAVLELLFQFMYRRAQPDVTKLEFALLSELAEAAEKYEVFPAMQVCQLRMSALIDEHPLQVLDYAGTHGYTDLASLAASKTTEYDYELVQKALTNVNFQRWMLFREKARKFMQPYRFLGVAPTVNSELHTYPNSYGSCSLWPKYQQILQSALLTYVKVVDVQVAFETNLQLYISECAMCQERARFWLREYEQRRDAEFRKGVKSVIF